MMDGYGENLLRNGIMNELARITVEERYELRELAGICLAKFLVRASGEVCDEIGEIGICEIVGNVKVSNLRIMIEVILKMVNGNRKWLEVVKQAGIESLHEEVDPNNDCQELIDLLMNVMLQSDQ
jgi:hypothetical protein